MGTCLCVVCGCRCGVVYGGVIHTGCNVSAACMVACGNLAWGLLVFGIFCVALVDAMRCLVDRNRSIPIISLATFPSVSIEVSKSTLCPQYKEFFHFVRTLMLEAFKILI
jgi:hypothetical protein